MRFPEQRLTVPGIWFLFATLGLFGMNAAAPAAPADVAPSDEFFRSRIEPILQEHCFRCHSHASDVMEGGLTLDSRSGWQQGGTTGPAIIAGKPEESLLISALRHQGPEMPPDNRLPDAVIADFVAWIEMGAPDPRVTPTEMTDRRELVWSLQPLKAMPVPAAGHPLDAFIDRELQAAGIEPQPQADPQVLIRRLFADLHGLPPDADRAEDMRQALVNPASAQHSEELSAEAWGQLVEDALASPRYGERWARHWLDTIHFADSHGYEHDIGREHAWRYRDYIINSLNRDTPWDQMIREQLAADIFFPQRTDAIPALGFLGAGTFDYSTFSTAKATFDYLDRDDLVTQTMSAFLSTTANCARCHTHKFDPITQQDYYALQAVFSGLVKGNRAYDPNADTGRQRDYWNSLIRAAESRDAAVLQQADLMRHVETWLAHSSRLAAWHPVHPETFHAISGSTLRRIPDDAILAEGSRPDTDTYVITGTSPLKTVTALRLDVLAHESLPKQGPGRQDNGNLHLSEIQLQIFSPEHDSGTAVRLVSARADFDQSGWGCERAIDNDPATAWGIHPEVGRSHYVIFLPENPLELTEGSRLLISLQQLHGSGHLIGAFRLSVSGTPGDQIEAVPAAVAEALAVDAARRSTEQQRVIATWALQSTAKKALDQLPDPSWVYAAGSNVEVPVGNGKHQSRVLEAPRIVHVLKRGDFDKPLEEIGPGALSMLTHLPARFELPPDHPEGLRRAALADWIAHRDNVLTWRSIVNRVWHYHFGRGLCDTPSDLGRMGGIPSHPELLDWLAIWFRDEAGGSLKQLHRLILTSRVWRRASAHDAAASAIDGDNRLLWRFQRFRLDADSVRDFTMAVAGTLDDTMGGPGVQHFSQSPGRQVTPVLQYSGYDWSQPGATRRSIYRFVWRGMADPFMDALDFPDLGLLAPSRSDSTSSLQALTLFNNEFVLFHSQALADRVRQAGSLDEQVAAAVRRVWGREPHADELQAMTAFASQQSLDQLCRVLLNSNEFLFVD